MTDFETKLEKIRQTFETIVIGANSKSDYIDARDHFDAEIKTLFADTLLKAIGNETKVSYSREDPIPFWRNIGRNKLRKELKAKILKKLGIKEKP